MHALFAVIRQVEFVLLQVHKTKSVAELDF